MENVFHNTNQMSYMQTLAHRADWTKVKTKIKSTFATLHLITPKQHMPTIFFLIYMNTNPSKVRWHYYNWRIKVDT